MGVNMGRAAPTWLPAAAVAAVAAVAAAAVVVSTA